MTQYLGNYKSQFNLDEILDEIKSSSGDQRTVSKETIPINDSGFAEIVQNWIDAGYNFEAIEWFNYYSETHFSKKFTDKFGLCFNAKPIKVWISKLRPGKIFPIHWDIDKNTSNFIDNKMVRYQMFLEDYHHGHFFVMDDATLTGYKSGDVYKWRDYREWHAGGNIGFVDKYIFNFLGIEYD